MATELNHRRALFWDVPEEAIEKALAESPDWVIPRVFQYGTVADIDFLVWKRKNIGCIAGNPDETGNPCHGVSIFGP